MTVSAPAGLANLAVTVASGDVLDTRQFVVHERMSTLFTITLVVRSENPDIDFDAVVGKPAKFVAHTASLVRPERTWTGICSQLQQVAVEPTGVSTYELTIVPTMWLMTQRRNHRIFQILSEPEIALKVLQEWGITPTLHVDMGSYKTRKYRVQYAESDFAFVCRMLEDSGISFYFEEDGGETKLVLCDAPQKNPPREPPIRFVDSPSVIRADHEHVTSVRIGQQVRPGKYTLRDLRLPEAARLQAPVDRHGRGTCRSRKKLESASTTRRAPSSSRPTRAATRPTRTTAASTAPTRARARSSRRSASTPSAAAPRASPSTPTSTSSRPAWGWACSITRAPISATASSSSSCSRRGAGPTPASGCTRWRPAAPTSPTARRCPRRSPGSPAWRAPPSSARPARRSTPTSSGASACSSTGIGRARGTRTARAGST